MNKHYNRKFDETYYTETLSNGMEVIIFHKADYLTTTACFGVKYGALQINQKVRNKEYHFNPGIAHFIEHKLFESEEKDIMSKFSALGANVNAFTSYKETVYYFSTVNDDIAEPLNLLLDFVQDLSITKESVEKEKGIISQELAMYETQPNSQLLNETYRSMYHRYPLRNDIAGTEESINSFTKEELEECYGINYHPSNMALVVASPVDPKRIIKIIRDNQNKKTFASVDKIETIDCNEPLEVYKRKSQIKMDVYTDKHVYAFKIKPSFKDVKDAFLKEWCLRILLEAHFSSVNPEYQKWLDEGVINDYFGYDIDFDMNSAYIIFYIENDDPKALRKLVDNTLKKMNLTEDLLNQIKRRYIGAAFDSFNDIESFALGYTRDYLGGLDFFESIRILKGISLEDVNYVYNNLDLSHFSYVSLKKKH